MKELGSVYPDRRNAKLTRSSVSSLRSTMPHALPPVGRQSAISPAWSRKGQELHAKLSADDLLKPSYFLGEKRLVRKHAGS